MIYKSDYKEQLMYKLVAIDLDGTLLNNEKEISKRNIKAIREACSKGVKIVICSGRVFSGARVYAKQVGVTGPVIACNGAVITRDIGGELMYASYMNKSDCFKVIDICKKYNTYYHIYAGDVMLTERLEGPSLRYYERNKTLLPEDRIKIEVVPDMREKLLNTAEVVLKFIIITQDLDILKNARAEAESLSNVTIMSSNYDNFEIMNKGVNKGDSLKQLAEMLNISSDEVMAIGDNENDLTMLSYAGLGVAMENAESNIKEAADYVTLSNEDDGVALAIEKFVL
jgi:Cof subfamily protein (haloacid dehalogenase superfamily)